MELLEERITAFRAFLRRRGESIDDADDLIQEALLRLLIYRQSRPVIEQDAFLKRTLQNLAVDRYRRRHRDLYVKDRPEELALPDLRPALDEHWSIRQDLDAVGLALDALPSRTREIFLMRRLDGCSPSQISKRFAISISAVEKHLGRAALAIRK